MRVQTDRIQQAHPSQPRHCPTRWQSSAGCDCRKCGCLNLSSPARTARLSFHV
nr:MAG TPA: hypothetical protein [Caudoviricetes sp.]